MDEMECKKYKNSELAQEDASFIRSCKIDSLFFWLNVAIFVLQVPVAFVCHQMRWLYFGSGMQGLGGVAYIVVLAMIQLPLAGLGLMFLFITGYRFKRRILFYEFQLLPWILLFFWWVLKINYMI